MKRFFLGTTTGRSRSIGKKSLQRFDASPFFPTNDPERSRWLVAGKGILEITASHSDLGEAHETLEVDYNKEELQVGFNYQYLLDFLTTADETQINFEFKDSESAAQLRTHPGNGLQLSLRRHADANLKTTISICG